MNKDPAVAAIIATDDDFEVCRRTIEYLALQTVVDRMEMVVVCPSASRLNPDMDLLARFGSHRIVEVGQTLTTGQVQSAGILAATSPYVMYFEEHSFPPPETLERALAVLEGTDLAALGFAMLPANPGLVAWAHLYLQFGQVAAPFASGEVDRLGGHHAIYRRDALAGYGPALADLMSNEAILHEDLRRRGTRMYVLGDVAIPHVKISDLASLMTHEFVSQRIYGETRAAFLEWSPLRRAAYVLGAPLIAAPEDRTRLPQRPANGPGHRVLPAHPAAAHARRSVRCDRRGARIRRRLGQIRPEHAPVDGARPLRLRQRVRPDRSQEATYLNFRPRTRSGRGFHRRQKEGSAVEHGGDLGQLRCLRLGPGHVTRPPAHEPRRRRQLAEGISLPAYRALARIYNLS
jgi:hypothetical protein